MPAHSISDPICVITHMCIIAYPLKMKWLNSKYTNTFYPCSCSQPPRKQHIPGYGGGVGAENLEELDNVQEKFEPFTVKRVVIPRYSETSQ